MNAAQARSNKYVYWALAAALTLSIIFHGFGLLRSAPWHVVYSDVLGFYETARAPGFPYLHKLIEYPVITGVFIHEIGRASCRERV